MAGKAKNGDQVVLQVAPPAGSSLAGPPAGILADASHTNPNDEMHIGWLVADVARMMRTVFDRRVRETGLTRPQWLALVRLKRRPGCSQSELADMMEIEKAPLGRIVDRLTEKGWIERRPDAQDRRINRIYLTDRGERVFAAISPISVATVEDALSDLPAADRDQLSRLLFVVKSTLADMAESDPAPEITWPGDDTAADDRQPIEVV